jgi:phospholipid/cholesterol/gamma-HCH transport system substrate-binding protein
MSIAGQLTRPERGRRRLLGAAALLAGFALVVLVALRPDPFKHTQDIWVRFDNVQGLGSIDRNVRAAGVNVGSIDTVKRVDDDALVKLEIDPDIVVHSDAIAALRPHTLFEGSDYVDLQPGSPSAPPLGEHVLPRSRTRVYISLDQATRVLRTSNREALRDLIRSGAKILDHGSVRSLRKVLTAAPGLVRNLGPVAQALRGPHGTELSGAISGMGATVRAVASRQADLEPLVRHAERTAAALETRGGAPLGAALRALPGPLRQLRDGGAQLTALVDRVDRLAVSLHPVVTELAPLLREGRPVLRAATPATRRAAPLVADLRTVLARVAQASGPVLDVVRTLRPGTKILAGSVLPYLDRRSRLGQPVYMQLVSAFTGATGALRPYQSLAQNPNGAGHLLRLGAYFDPQASANGFAKPSCAVIALINPKAAAALKAVGLCQP